MSSKLILAVSNILNEKFLRSPIYWIQISLELEMMSNSGKDHRTIHRPHPTSKCERFKYLVKIDLKYLIKIDFQYVVKIDFQYVVRIDFQYVVKIALRT